MNEDHYCPDCEKLDEYREGVGQSSAHIDECPECQRKIAAYDMIDARMNVLGEVPAGLSERIKKAVHSGRRPSIRPFHFWLTPAFRWSASAAVMVMLAMLSSVLVYGRRASNEIADNRDIELYNKVLAKEMAPVADLAEYRFKEMQFEIPREQEAKVYQNNYLRLAAVGNAKQDEKNEFTKSNVILASQVRHIWTVDDLDDVECFLRKVAEANGQKFEIARNDEEISAQFRLKDTEIQQLVDMMNKKEWKLLSPQLPQPNAEDAIDFVGKYVNYYAMFIHNK